MGEKIISIYNRCAEWFCTTLGKSDRWAHLFVGVVVAFFFAKADSCLWHRSDLVAVVFATLFTFWLMVVKEIVDFFRGGKFDLGDILSGIIGGVIGCLFFVL